MYSSGTCLRRIPQQHGTVKSSCAGTQTTLSSKNCSRTVLTRSLYQPLAPSDNEKKSQNRRGDSHIVRCSYEEAYKKIRENRLARKLAKEQAATLSLETPSEGDADFVSRDGDVVTVQWEGRLVSNGQLIDRTSPMFGATNKPGGVEVPLDIQLGTTVGFAPKHGLKLAFSLVCGGMKAGETTSVLSKPGGSGWLRSYDIYSSSGKWLCQLGQEERTCSWASEPTIFNLTILKVQPAAGREAKRKLGLASNKQRISP
ncbi:hypothetical protein CEUSTIGMA_g9274.t1 [Chlamydomonas eustigma]|uniref:Uncharacterized protein n=1 Tax=Chlamydomonas eustigma TaxID=1157962 RepID=A0A250XFN7_9CHLO|nr:hypothetical protein CEUSTIGMA_g9274.t1 [Chlamydomonas eustigma]|eukprot:GAX81846.1 hypothetical protein CEUSTIGMA_g9274.t1 [Chlamydomonas eustigma]